eukprot:7983737-Pyramimonas_sp.AAC.1
MAVPDALHLSAPFERIPLEVEAGDVGWVERPRLCWAPWDLAPSRVQGDRGDGDGLGGPPRQARGAAG